MRTNATICLIVQCLLMTLVTMDRNKPHCGHRISKISWISWVKLQRLVRFSKQSKLMAWAMSTWLMLSKYGCYQGWNVILFSRKKSLKFLACIGKPCEGVHRTARFQSQKSIEFTGCSQFRIEVGEFNGAWNHFRKEARIFTIRAKLALFHKLCFSTTHKWIELSRCLSGNQITEKLCPKTNGASEFDLVQLTLRWIENSPVWSRISF